MFQLHLVHWNRSQYPSPNVAAGNGNGLAVLGLFLEIDEEGHDHPELAKLIPYLDKIPFKENKAILTETILPENFLPEIDMKAKDSKEARRFWTYNGSLTTPPLLESVIWVVFQQPMKVSRKQVK